MKNSSFSGTQKCLIRIVTLFSLIFLVISIILSYKLYMQITTLPTITTSNVLQNLYPNPNAPFNEQYAASQLQATVWLELSALEYRYHQANMLLLSRTWIQYLGFFTGMILAFIGAFFILAHLREPISEVGMESTGIKVSFKSASSGTILAGLGVVLILATIFTHHSIIVADKSIYTQGWNTKLDVSTAIQQEKEKDGKNALRTSLEPLPEKIMGALVQGSIQSTKPLSNEDKELREMYKNAPEDLKKKIPPEIPKKIESGRPLSSDDMKTLGETYDNSSSEDKRKIEELYNSLTPEAKEKIDRLRGFPSEN